LGQIYIIHTVHNDGLVKIGKSDNFDERFKAYQRTFLLAHLFEIEATSNELLLIEKSLHKNLAGIRTPWGGYEYYLMFVEEAFVYVDLFLKDNNVVYKHETGLQRSKRLLGEHIKVCIEASINDPTPNPYFELLLD